MLDLAEVCKLYNVNFGNLDVLKCEHKISFTNCAECCQKVSSMWLLDSGISVHFTNNKNDFIKYTPSERQPVRTATHTIWVEGQGTVLLRHYVNGTLVMTRVHPVLYIPAVATQLLSMGEFLQSGLCMKGNSQCITLTHKNKPFVQRKPLIIGQTLYWLDALTTTVEAHFIEAIYKVDYNLMHCHLGHHPMRFLDEQKSIPRVCLMGFLFLLLPKYALDVCKARCPLHHILLQIQWLLKHLSRYILISKVLLNHHTTSISILSSF